MLGMPWSRRRWIALLGFVLLGAAGAIGFVIYREYFQFAIPEARNLRSFVRVRPTHSIVFTSRSGPQSLEAAAPEAEGYSFPGTIPWAAAEGRLRLLTADGRVFELTHGRQLPDGSTLIDVMSPSISLDGERILFAGRKSAPDPGHWRIYQINVNGSDLKQLTGGPDDPGCVALPPMRYSADGSQLSDEVRKRTDYDDVDPADRGDGSVLFASSRIPDLGRDHSRRSTQLWQRTATGEMKSLSANRNNDRWPVLMNGEWIVWSLWSRNREAVTADRTELRPVSEGGEYATKPTDNWMAARVYPDGSHFGYLVKIPEPVWRPRPLFNGQIAFMTLDPATQQMRLAQAPVGLLRIAPSSQSGGGPLPIMVGAQLTSGPTQDAQGNTLVAGCPSPCPPGDVLFAARPASDAPHTFGLWRVSENWEAKPTPELFFDDPNFVDAEPVAVYQRKIDIHPQVPSDSFPPEKMSLPLLSGRIAHGPFGQVEAHFLNIPLEHPIPNIATDTGAGPVFTNPTGVKSIVIYGAHRDRFNDPKEPRVRGEWEKLVIQQLDKEFELRSWIPADPLMPTVLAGLGEDGKIFKWASPATDSTGRSASFYAYAGDHYSGMRPKGYVFCNGCHTGHTFLSPDVAERAR